jgi:hypothetical protein
MSTPKKPRAMWGINLEAAVARGEPGCRQGPQRGSPHLADEAHLHRVRRGVLRAQGPADLWPAAL